MIRKTSPAEIEPYLTDASNFHGQADGVAVAQSEKEIQEFLRDCHSKKIPVTVAGSGTGLTGARVPLGGWVLATEKFAKIKSIQKGSTTPTSEVGGSSPHFGSGGGSAIVEPGVSWGDLDRAAREAGLLYAPDPTSYKSLIGGNLATNASGPRSFKYGATRPYVERLRVTLSDGTLMDLKRGQTKANRDGILELPHPKQKIKIKIPSYNLPPVKHTAGYFAAPQMDAVDLFIGSEGTLGVVTEVELALLPQPRREFSFVAFFSAEENSWAFVAEARRLTHHHLKQRNDAAIQASALEYLDGPSLDLIGFKYPDIPQAARAAVYVEQECQAETADILWDSWQALIEKKQGEFGGFWFADEAESYARLRAFRHEVPLQVRELLAKTGRTKIGTDMALPVSRFEHFMHYQTRRLKEIGIRNLSFGHIGDCHLHLNMLPENESEKVKAWQFYDELIAKTLEWGGSVAGEHGIGKIKKKYLPLMFGKQGIDQMLAVKHALDPLNILGRGTLFET